jgi:penicillin-binding protein 1C
MEWFYRKNHPEYQMLPLYKKGCTPENEFVMDLIQPDNNSAIYIPQGLDELEGMIILEAVHRNQNATIYWHIDEQFITSTKEIHKIEVSPTIGHHKLTIVDQDGNMVARTFNVISK